VGEIVPEGGEGAVDVRGLAAAMAMRTRKGGAAIEAASLACRAPFPGVRLHRARGQAARHRFADAFETPGHHRSNMAEAKRRVETLCEALLPHRRDSL
jgi:hypothetical protein